ncbi:MAG: putative Ig domain-containing protein [Magnetococcus sp. MYC-9]
MMTPHTRQGLSTRTLALPSPWGHEVAASEGVVLLADAALFLEGDFVREGSALVIIRPTGERVVVADYFLNDPPPILTAPNGAFLLPETVALLLPVEGVLVAGPTIVPGQPTGAGTVGAGQAAGGSIGSVKGVSGAVTARSQGGESRTLKQGDAVFEGEEIKTAEGGQLQLLFVDGTQFQLGTGARIVLNKYLYNPAAAQGEFSATVMKGAFAYSSGAMAHQHAGRHTVLKTPTAVIGVRGSALQGEVAENGQTTVVHTAGILDISNAQGQGTVTLLQPGMATIVTLDGTPQPAFQATKDILDRFNAILPSVLPGQKPDPVGDKGDSARRDTSADKALLESLTTVSATQTHALSITTASLDAIRSLSQGVADALQELSSQVSAPITLVGINLTSLSGVQLAALQHDLIEINNQLTAPAPTVRLLRGTFLDSAVAGIQYQTATQEGTTDGSGGFWYQEGETVRFAIGDIEIGQTTMGGGASPIVTPTQLAATAAGSGQSAPAQKKTIESNIIRLLQTLDSDGDPSNGIHIPSSAQQSGSGATAKAIRVTAENFDSDPNLLQFVKLAKGSEQLVTAETAENHYTRTQAKIAALSDPSVSLLSAIEDKPFSFALPADTFQSQTGAALRYATGALPAWLHFDAATLTFSGTPGNQDVGGRTFSIRAAHGAGVNTASVNFQLMVDNVNDSPMAPTLGPQAVRVDPGHGLQLPIPFTDPDLSLGDSLTFQATLADGSPLPDWLHFDTATRTLTSADLATASQNRIKITAEDLAHDRASTEFTLTVDTPPTLLASASLRGKTFTATEGQPFTFAVQKGAFQEVDPWDSLSFSAKASGRPLPKWLHFDPDSQTFSGTPGSGDGAVLIQISATDQSGFSVDDSFRLRVAHGNHAPVASTTAPQLALVGHRLDLTLTPFTDVDPGEVLLYSATLVGGAPLPSWLQFDGESRTLIANTVPADAVSSYRIQVTAVDGSLASASSAFTLTVDTPPSRVATIPLPDQSAGHGQKLIFTLPDGAFQESDVGDRLSYAAVGLPAWLTFDPASRTFSGTPGNNDGGNRTITVIATDLAGANASDTFQLSVGNANHAPTLAKAIGTKVAIMDKTFRFAIPGDSFADADAGDLLSYGEARRSDGSPLPAWLTFDRATGTFFGIPGRTDIAALAVLVTVSDKAGAPVTDTFTLNVVQTGAPPVVVTPLSPQAATQDQLFKFQMDANTFRPANAGDPLQYSARGLDGSELPAWLRFDAASRTFSGTPDNGAVGQLSIKVTATDTVLGSAVSDSFVLSVANVNDRPTVRKPVPSQLAPVGSTFLLRAADIFQDVDVGDRLTLSATLQDGSPLPAWLTFTLSDPAAGGQPTFRGTPASSDVGFLLGLELTATDLGKLSVADDFLLLITPPNNAPTKGADIANQKATQGSLFLYEIPAISFADKDLPLDRLTYTAQLADGQPLPSWLTLDGDTRTLSGTPGNADVTSGTPLTLRVTATDRAGATAQSNLFQMAVANVNDAPQVGKPLVNQSAFYDKPDQAFVFRLPEGSFTDVDIPHGDRLALSVSRVGTTTDLPSWLTFDTASGTFSKTRTLTEADKGTYNFKVTATDTSQAQVSDLFSITVRASNSVPTLEKRLTAQNGRQDQPFILELDRTAFQDKDSAHGDQLTWTAALSSGAILPAWLVFDGASQTFIGTPRNADVATLEITVKATDREGASAQDSFKLTVANLNDAPTLTAGKEIADQKVTLGNSFQYILDADTFTDVDQSVDAQATLTLTATLLDGTQNGTPLSANSSFWLHFDPINRTFSGTPKATDPTTVSIKVTATDNGATPLSVADLFNVTLNRAPTTQGITAPGHATQGQLFRFKLPVNSFQDSDVGDSLTLSASLTGGGALPDWLTFDPGSRTFFGIPGNADVGTLALTVQATDSGNARVSTPLQLVVDNVNDAPTLVNKVADQTVEVGKALSLALGSAFRDVDAGDRLTLSTAIMNVNSTDPSASWLRLNQDLLSGTAPATPTDLVVKLTATDSNGAKSSDIFTLHVVPLNHAPQLQTPFSTTQTATQDQVFAFRIPRNAFQDADGDALSLTASRADGSPLPGWLLFDADTGGFIGKPGNSDVGSLAVKVTATDPRGAQSSGSFTVNVANVNDAPQLNPARSIAAQTVTQGSAFKFMVPADRFTDIDGSDTLTLAATLSGGGALPSWLQFKAENGRYLFSSAASDGPPASTPLGPISIRLTATDAGGLSIADTVTLHVQAPNNAPTLQRPQGNRSTVEETPFTYQVPLTTFQDKDAGDNLTYTARLLDGTDLSSAQSSFWLRFDPGTRTFFGTPVNRISDGQLTDEVGTLKVKVTATDSRGEAVSDLFDLTVTNSNDAPVLSRPVAGQALPLTATRGSNFQLQLAANTFQDPDQGDLLSLSAATPAWLTFDPGSRTFSGTPGQADQTTTIKLTARDTAGATAFDLFTLNVVDANRTPVLSGTVADQLQDQSIQQGVSLRYQFTQNAFSDPDLDPLTYTASLANGASLPTWLRFDADTRTFSGQPGNADVGNWSVKITATDPGKASVASTFNVVVNNVNDAPTVAHTLKNQGVVRGSSFQYQFAADTFVDVDVGDTLKYSASGLVANQSLPNWLRFDPATRTFSGTPGVGDVGTVYVKVTAEDAAHATVADTFRLQVAESQSGILLDSKVIGVSYTATSQSGAVTYSGLTDGDGLFKFLPGDTVTFSIGGIVLGRSTGSSIITPVNLSGSDNVAGVTNMLRLLQTLDIDGDPENGITISQAARSAAAGKSLDFNLSADAFAASSAVGHYLQSVDAQKTSLVSTESAWRHFIGTLASAGSGANGLLSTSSSTVAPIPVAVEESPFSYKLAASLFDAVQGSGKQWEVSRLDGKPLPTWLSFDSDTLLFSGTPGNEEVGEIALRVIASDAAKNRQSELVNITVLNSNDAPTLKEGGFSNKSAILGRSFFFQVPGDAFNDVDRPYGDRLSFAATLANNTPLPSWLSFDPETGTFSGTPSGKTDEGSITVKVTASDRAGSIASGLFDLTVSAVNAAPVLKKPLSEQTVPAATEKSPFRFQLSADTFDDADIATSGDTLRYAFSLAEGGDPARLAWLRFDADTRTFSGTPSQADVGTFAIKVSATDKSGARAIDSFNLLVKDVNDAPTLVKAMPKQVSSLGEAFRFSLDPATFADADPGDRLTLSASRADGSKLPDWLLFDPQTATFTGTPTTSGVVNIRVTATDKAAASVSGSFDLSVQAVNHAPTLNAAISLSPPSITEGKAFTYALPTGHFFDSDNDPLSFSARLLAGGNLPAWLTFDSTNNRFSGTPSVGSAGVLGIKITAQDPDKAAVVDTFNLTIAAVNRAPELKAALADQPATVGKLFNLQIDGGAFADGDAGDRLSYAATLQGGAALPAWLKFDADTRAFNGTPQTTDAGTYQILVTAKDSGGLTASDLFAVTVANLNRAPLRSSLPMGNPATIAEGQTLRFALPSGAFSDPDSGDTLALSVVNMLPGVALPSWLTFDSKTATFSGTPGAGDIGSLGVKVIATDQGGLTVADTFTLGITAVNKAPVLNNSIADQLLQRPLAEQKIIAGVPFLFKLNPATFTDPNPGDRLALTASNLPTWLKFDAASLTFSGTPVAGVFKDITLTATDSATVPLSKADRFTLTVSAPNHAPILAKPILEQTAKQGGNLSFPIPAATFADIDAGDRLTLSIGSASASSPLPTWLQFNAANNTLSSNRSLTNDDVGSFDVKVQATDSGGEKIFTTFTISVANVNDAPTFVKTNPVPDLSKVSTGVPLVFAIPDDTFADIDVIHGDTLSLSARLADGKPLPTWLFFDPTSGTFSGTPGSADRGTLSLQVRATDSAGATADSNVFKITVADLNRPPVLSRSLSGSPVTATQGQPFTLKFAEQSASNAVFTDPDSGDTLRYEATLLSGDPLPGWLRFDAANRTFSGTPGNGHVGTWEIKLVALDPSGAKAFDTFSLVVANLNDRPTGTVLITGTAAQESLLTVSNTLADLDGLGPIGYQWQVSANGSTGWSTVAWGESFTPGQDEAGKQLRVVASYTDGYGTAESVASATVAVLNANDRPSGGVEISSSGTGAVLPGSVLTAFSTLTDEDGLGTIGYQWQRSADGVSAWTNISNATSSSLTVSQAEASQYVRVVASYTDGQGSKESVASEITAVANQGLFVDSAVAGVEYHTASQSGITGTRGEFYYLTGETVSFAIGGISLGETTGKGTVTPLDLAASTDAATNIVRLLQTLDSDASPANGITIAAPTRSLATGVTTLNVNASLSAFENDGSLSSFLTAVKGQGRGFLTNAVEAQAHFLATLTALSPASGSSTLQLSDNRVVENSSLTQAVTVGTLTAQGSGAPADPIFWIVGGADQGVFALVGNQLTIPAGTVVDYERRSTLTVEIATLDASGLTAPHRQTVTVQVVDVANENNLSPVVRDSARSAGATERISFTMQDFAGLTYDGDGGSLVKIRLTALPEVGTLQLNGVALSTGQEIAATALDQLLFVPNTAAGGWRTPVRFSWQASDGTDWSTTTAQVTLTPMAATSLEINSTLVPGNTSNALLFAVNLSAGTTYTFDLQGAASGQGTIHYPHLVLRDEMGNPIEAVTGWGTDAQLIYTPTVSKTYYLDAQSIYAETGSYHVRAGATVDVGQTPTTAAAFTLGTPLSSTIATAADSDWFSVPLTAGTLYQFDLQGATGGHGTLYDTHLVLRDGAGAVVNSASNSSGDSRTFFVPTASGNYYLDVQSRYAETGSYALSGTAIVAQSLASGSASGAIASSTETDWFALPLTAGTVYTLQLQGAASGRGSLSNPHMILFSGAGERLDEAGWGGDATASFRPTSSGTYYLQVQGLQAEMGSYTLSSSTSTVNRMSGGAVTGSISAAGETDLFELSLTAGTLYAFDLQGSNSGHGTLVNPHLLLRNSSGALLSEAGWGGNARILYTPTVSDTYYLNAQGLSAETGSYTLNSQAVTATALGAETPTRGDIGAVGESDLFQISLTAGTPYTLALQGAAGGHGTLTNPRLMVRDSQGYLAYDSDWYGSSGDVRSVFTPWASGTYYLDAQGHATQGSYRLSVGSSVDVGATGATAQPLTIGQSVAGEITTSGDADWFQVNLSAGALYSFALQGAGSGRGTLYGLHLALRDGTGGLLDESLVWGDAQLVYRPTVSGTYYLDAQSISETGTYTLSSSTMTVTPLGDSPISGAISTSGEVDRFALTLTTDSIYGFELQGAASGHGTLANPHLLLRTEAGDLLGEFGWGGDVRAGYVPTRSGTYYLDVQGLAAESGSYTLRKLSATLGSVSVNGSVSGTLSAPGESDWFALSLTAGNTYTFSLQGAASGQGSLSQTHLQLRTGTGDKITDFLYSSGQTDDSLFVYTPSVSGAYYLDVQAKGMQTGSYTLQVTTAPTLLFTTPEDDSVGVGTGSNLQLYFSEAVVAGIGRFILSDGTDVRSIDVNDASQVMISGNTVLLNPTEDLRGGSRYTLQMARGLLLDGAGDPFAGIEGSAALSFTVAADVGSTITTAADLAIGGRVSGEIAASTDSDWFQVNLTAGTAYTFELLGAASGAGTLYNTHLILRDSTGALVGEAGVGGNARTLYKPTVAGRYYVDVQGLYGETGSYTLSSATVVARNLAVGQSVTDSIGSASETDPFQISLNAGTVYTFNLQGTASGRGTLSYPHLVLRDGAGALLSEAGWGGDVRTSYTPATSGQYYLDIQGYGADVGSYTLEVSATIDEGNTPGTASILAVGQSKTGLLTTYDSDWFAITLAAGSSYTFDLQGSTHSHGTLPDPYLVLRDSAGVILDSNDDFGGADARIVYTATVSGTYYLEAQELRAVEGSYRISARFNAVEVHAPSVVLPTGPQTAAVGQSFTVSIPPFADADPNDILTYTASMAGSPLPAWLIFDSITRTFFGVPGSGDVGTIPIRLTATDRTGASAADDFTITITNTGNHAPYLLLPTPAQTVTAGQAFSLSVNPFADQDSGDVLTYSASAAGSPLPGWLTFDPGSRLFSGTPGSGDVGTIPLHLTATDRAGASVSEGFSLTVTASGTGTNHAPFVVTPTAPQTATTGQGFSLYIAPFADEDFGDILTYSASASGGSLPGWLTFDPGSRLFYGSPGSNDAGTLHLRVTGTDRAGASATEEFSLTVISAGGSINHAPVVISPPANHTATANQSFSLSVFNHFSDSDPGDVLTFSASVAGGSSLPAWLTFVQGGFSGTPGSGDVGSFPVQVTATDRAGASVSAHFTLAVNAGSVAVNHAPYVASPTPSQSLTVGETFFLPIYSFADTDAGDTLTYSASAAGSSLPGWLTFDRNGRYFYGTPSANDVGSIPIHVTATDQAGASASEGFSITVTSGATVNHAPFLVAPTVAPTASTGQFFSLSVNSFADQDPGDSLTYSASSAGAPLPGWLTFDGVGRYFYGMPGSNDVGTIPIQIVAMDRAGAGASETFTITVVGGATTNHAPFVSSPTPSQTTPANQSFYLPIYSMVDADLGDTLTYSATMNGSPLPGWLTFDPIGHYFYGMPGNSDAGTFPIRLIATDSAGASVSENFSITVAAASASPPVISGFQFQPANSRIVLNFDKPIVAGTTGIITLIHGSESVSLSASDPHVTISGNLLTINTAMNSIDKYYVYLDYGVVTDAVGTPFTGAMVDPLVLDLDGDGLHLTAPSVGPRFDMNGDGHAEPTGWIGARDGLLVLDQDGDGQIQDIREVVSEWSAAHVSSSLAALATLDSNRNGWVEADDARFGQLRVWVDQNQDGVSAPTELHTLSQLGMTFLGLQLDPGAATVMQGNRVSGSAQVVYADGHTGSMFEVALAVATPLQEGTTDPAMPLETGVVPSGGPIAPPSVVDSTGAPPAYARLAGILNWEGVQQEGDAIRMLDGGAALDLEALLAQSPLPGVGLLERQGAGDTALGIHDILDFSGSQQSFRVEGDGGDVLNLQQTINTLLAAHSTVVVDDLERPIDAAACATLGADSYVMHMPVDGLHTLLVDSEVVLNFMR